MLNPEEFGVTLSETFQIDPEQSTCAIIVPHFKPIITISKKILERNMNNNTKGI
ncbi:hypothetical protein [Halarcobacter anaerophilus]|uniref:hypothetical protein n=1 Tax=Halarcobacter anaerophilus TaxID=877500 RepID=UPI000A6961DA|nr:hypothetical protein [Halarcobacter anaerophilus]